jgi:hypothetical protein
MCIGVIDHAEYESDMQFGHMTIGQGHMTSQGHVTIGQGQMTIGQGHMTICHCIM